MTIFDKGRALMKRRSSKSSDKAPSPNKLRKRGSYDEKEVGQPNPPPASRYETEVLPELPTPPPPPVAGSVVGSSDMRFIGVHGLPVQPAYFTPLPAPPVAPLPQQQYETQPAPPVRQGSGVTDSLSLTRKVYSQQQVSILPPPPPATPPQPFPPALQLVSNVITPIASSQAQHPQLLAASVITLWTLTLLFILMISAFVSPVVGNILTTVAKFAFLSSCVYAAMMTARAYFAAQAARYASETNVARAEVEIKRIDAGAVGRGALGPGGYRPVAGMKAITGAAQPMGGTGFHVPATYDIEEVG